MKTEEFANNDLLVQSIQSGPTDDDANMILDSPAPTAATNPALALIGVEISPPPEEKHATAASRPANKNSSDDSVSGARTNKPEVRGQSRSSKKGKKRKKAPADHKPPYTVSVEVPSKKRKRLPAEQFNPGHENGKGILQQEGVSYDTYYKSNEAQARMWWTDHLKPAGWKRGSGKIGDHLFFPGIFVEAGVTKKKMVDLGMNGVHYADGNEKLYELIKKYGVFGEENPDDKCPQLLYLCNRLVKTEWKNFRTYRGNPSDIKLHEIILKLNAFEYKSNSDVYIHKSTKKAYTCQELPALFVINGIPGISNLKSTDRKKLEECVKFAHVNLPHLNSARNGL